MLKIHEINEFDEFAKLENKWNTVLGESKDDSPLLTWEKMAASVMFFNKHQKLRILYVTDNNNIIGIAPLRQSQITLRGPFGYSVLEPIAYGNTDYSSFILSKKTHKCLQIIFTYLYSKNDWNYLYINDVPEKSTLLDLLLKNRTLFPRFKVEKGIRCPYITIPSTMEELFQNLSANFRKNLRKSLRKLEKYHGKVELKNYYEIGSLEDTIKIFFNLHQKRWISKGDSGNFSSQEQRDIYLSTAKLLAKKNWFALYFLTVNNKPIAAKYCLKYKQVIYGNLAGLDPSYSTYSVGNLLMFKILERCIENKTKEYDFMQGEESYKYKWTKNYCRTYNLEFVNSTFNSQLIRLLRVTTQKMKILNLLGRAAGRQTSLPAR